MRNPGSILHGMLRFRWIRGIRGIRFRTPRRPKIEYSTVILAHWAGKWRPILRSTLKKPKENQCFRLQPLKNLRKINVFGLWSTVEPCGAPGVPWRPIGHPQGPWGPCQQGSMWPHRSQSGPKYIHKLPIHRHRAAATRIYALGTPWAPRDPWGPIYIHKLPIHRHRAAVTRKPDRTKCTSQTKKNEKETKEINI